MTYRKPAIWNHEALPLDRIKLGDVISYRKDDQSIDASEDRPGILYQVDYEQVTIGEETLFRPAAVYVFPIISKPKDTPHKIHDRLLPLHETETGHLNHKNVHAAEIRLVRVPLDKEHLGYHPARLHIAGSMAGTTSGERLFERAQPYGLNALSSSLRTDLATFRHLSGYQSALARIIQETPHDQHDLGGTAFEPNTVKAFLGYLSAQNQKSAPIRPIPLFFNDTDAAPMDDSQDWIASGHLPDKAPWKKFVSLMSEKYGTAQISDLQALNLEEIEDLLSSLQDEKPSYAEIFRLSRILSKYAPDYPTLQDTVRRMYIQQEAAQTFEKNNPKLAGRVREGLGNGADIESLITYTQEQAKEIPARKQLETIMRAINFITYLYREGIAPSQLEVRTDNERRTTPRQKLKHSFNIGLSQLLLDDAQKIFHMEPDVVKNLKDTGATTLMDAYNQIKDGYREDVIEPLFPANVVPRRGRPRHLGSEAQMIADEIEKASKIKSAERAQVVLTKIQENIRRHAFNVVANAVNAARGEFSKDRLRYENTDDGDVRAEIAAKYGFKPS